MLTWSVNFVVFANSPESGHKLPTFAMHSDADADVKSAALADHPHSAASGG
jgi:hypothetical protein